ncbi:MAG: hypothetical protein V4692_13970, partial [Bdellovibrionota bacterium]
LGLIENADWMEPDQRASEVARLKKMIELGRSRINSVTCLEKELFRIHDSFVAPGFRYSEFGAVVLLSPDRRVMRVHFATDRSNNGSLDMSMIAGQVRSDLKRGFTPYIHLHSHPFDFQNPSRDFAPIGPSGPDLELYIAGRFEYGIITNGLDSFRMERAAYEAIYSSGSDRLK